MVSYRMPLEVARFLSSSFHRHNLNQQTKRIKYLELKAKLADRKLHVLKHTDHKLDRLFLPISAGS
jgi:hypothetical protein